ncbi:MAG: hypothetical protein SynsKO_05890 [Synoicihabitans sp.]
MAEMGFLRLLTQQRVMETCKSAAFTNDRAVELLAQVRRDEVIGIETDAPGTRALWLALARGSRASPRIWMDAYLAALAITREMELVTFDQGFENYRKAGLELRLLSAT